MIVPAVLAAIGVSFFLSALATQLVKRVAHRLDFLDRPGMHKAHAKATPLLGGAAIFGSILGPAMLVLAVARVWAARGVPKFLLDTDIGKGIARHVPGIAMRMPAALVILLAALALHVLGLIDDRKHLGPWIKLLVQVLAATAVAVFADVRVLTVAGPAISVVASVLWIVLITNSFNFLDNMDGLCAGVGAIIAAALLAASASVGQIFVPALLGLVLGSLLGFLPHNFAPASIFMGDAGSLVVGFLLAVASCMTTYVPAGITDPALLTYGLLVPLVVMAIPMYDTASVMTIRIREGRNPMVGDRRHFSHRLASRGMSKRRVALTIYLCTAGTAIAAVLLPRVNDMPGAILLVLQTVLILGIIALMENEKKTA